MFEVLPGERWMPFNDVIKNALDQLQYIAKTETVFGEPITAGPVTLIPVSKVSVGFAAAGAGKEEKSGSGSATGGGATITPVAFISISDQKVQVHPISKSDPNLNKLLSLAPDLYKKISKYLSQREKKKNDAAGHSSK
jgi:uncharacterized spore protein YtfJ